MPLRLRTIPLALVLVFAAVPAFAQVVQSVQVGAGVVLPRGFDSRSDDDVLVRNLIGESLPALPGLSDALTFEIGDFRTGQLFGEWNVAFGDHVEVGAGLGFYRKSVPTVYLDLIDDSGLEIEQQLRLRVVPVTGVVRFLPFGGPADVQPYVGVGISILNFQYTEAGAFVDGETLEVFEDRFRASGSTLGGLLLGGVRVPLGGDLYGFGIEGRYQFGTGETGGVDEGFLADTIDLGATQLNFTFLVRF